MAVCTFCRGATPSVLWNRWHALRTDDARGLRSVALADIARQGSAPQANEAVRGVSQPTQTEGPAR
jgi:hypothetical protein